MDIRVRFIILPRCIVLDRERLVIVPRIDATRIALRRIAKARACSVLFLPAQAVAQIVLVIDSGVEMQVDVRLRVVKIVHAREAVLARVLVPAAAVVAKDGRVVLTQFAVAVVQREVRILADASLVAETVCVALAVALIDLHRLKERGERVEFALVAPLHVLALCREAEGELVRIVKAVGAAHTVVLDRAVEAQRRLEILVPVLACDELLAVRVDGHDLAL